MIAFVFYAMVISASENEAAELGLPQCHETAITGIWWPDMQCAEQEFSRADTQLNRVWKTVIYKKNKYDRKKIIESERNCIKKVDYICNNILYLPDVDIIVIY